MESMNNLYDQIKHPENAFLIGFMFLANTYEVNMQTMVNSLKTFNSANCVNASFRDKINEEIAQTCCYREDQLKRDISAMQIQQVQWSMMDNTIRRIHTACTENRERLNTSVLQSSKTSFDLDSRILTIEHDTEGVAFYVDNMSHETVSTTMVNLYANKVIFDGMHLDNVPISLRDEVEKQLKELGFVEEIENYESNKAFIDAIEAINDSFMERTEVEKEKAKPYDIYAGDGFIMRSLRKLVMTANSIIGWFVDELSHDFL